MDRSLVGKSRQVSAKADSHVGLGLRGQVFMGSPIAPPHARPARFLLE